MCYASLAGEFNFSAKTKPPNLATYISVQIQLFNFRFGSGDHACLFFAKKILRVERAKHDLSINSKFFVKNLRNNSSNKKPTR